nr:beta-propeller domain-containing protein [Planctomycetota bacterium]
MNKHNAFKLSFVLLAVIVLSVIVWRLKEDPRTLQKQSSPAISSVFETVKNKLSGQEKIKQFASYEDLKNFMSANASNSYDGMVGGIVRSGLKTLDAVAPSSAVMEKGTASGSEIAPIANQADSQKTTDYSKTNVQVEGVDEADIIKTDGAYVYAVTQKDLFIIKAFPASQAETVAKIEFKSFPSDIYISGDRLVVFGYDDQILNQPFYRSFIRPNSFAFVKIFDISDKKNPKQVKDLSIEGNYTDSRLINDQLYFITNNYSYGGDPILPRIVDGGEVISSKCSGVEKCVMPPIYYFDIPYSSYSFTNITVLDIKNDQEKPSNYIYLLDGGQNLFVSQSNIYITYTKYLNEYDLEMEVTREVIFPLLNTSDKDKISKIEATDNFILSEAEKRQKVNSIIERFASSLAMEEQNKLQKTIEDKIEQKFKEKEKEMEKTMIYKIAINPKAEEKLVFKATGEVPGSVLNQFSMDENGAYFRIATTQHARWSRFAKEEKKSTNNLYVLDENLKTIGALEDV